MRTLAPVVELRRMASGERTPPLQVLKTALAVGLSWEVVTALLGHTVPVFAALAALLTVQITVYQSVSRALQRVLGVVAGVLVAYLIAREVGLHAWSVGLVVLCALAVGWLLGLGPQAAIQVPISALLVMVLGAATPGYAIDRIVDTAVGAAVGVAVNAAIVAPTNLLPTAGTVTSLARALRLLLVEMSDADSIGDPSRTAGWLVSARDLGTLAQEAEQAVNTARESARWNPSRRARSAAIEAYGRAAVTLEHVVVQVRGVTRTLADAAADTEALPLGEPARRALSRLLAAAATSVAAVEAVADGGPGAGLARLAAERAAEDFEPAVADLRMAARRHPGSAWMAYGAVAEDVRRILEECAAASSATSG